MILDDMLSDSMSDLDTGVPYLWVDMNFWQPADGLAELLRAAATKLP